MEKIGKTAFHRATTTVWEGLLTFNFFAFQKSSDKEDH